MKKEALEKRHALLSGKRLNTEEFQIRPYVALNRSTKNVKFFDEKMVFHIVPLRNAFGKVEGIYAYEDGRFLCDSFHTLYCMIGKNNDIPLFMMALTKLQDGDSYEKFLQICKEAHYNLSTEPMPWIDRFIAKIESPSIERETDNLNKKTFDFVRIRILLSDLQVDTKEEVKRNFEEILMRAIQKIQRNKAFQKYGVPVNFLKVTKVTLTQQKVLEILFELKQPKGFPESENEKA